MQIHEPPAPKPLFNTTRPFLRPAKWTVLLVSLLFFAAGLSAKNVVVIEDKIKPRSEKEAILILPGFGSKLNGTKHQRRFFQKKGYDLFIPDYISRKSMDRTLQNFDQFYEKQRLGEYSRVHVFAYIVGSWTINAWLEKHSASNISTIIYDRSPLQERAPQVLIKDSPRIIRLLAGPIMRDFSEMPYPVLAKKKGIRVGIIIESKATKLIKRHRKTTLALGPIRWDLENLGQPADDFFYTWLDHDRMYKRFDMIGAEVFGFIKKGRFSETARRKPYEGDPFLEHKQ